jgi:RNA polymerase II subunit A small phosphatase-like protein
LLAIRLLVLDLDETLVFATDNPLHREPDWIFNEYSIYRRPHLEQFIQHCTTNFHIGLWSSAGEEYVSFMANQLFPEANSIKFAWSGKRCIQRSSGISNIKDLRKLRRFGYLAHEILIVDDSPEKVCRQPKNLVKIAPYDGNLDDAELLNIIAHIEEKRVQFSEKPTLTHHSSGTPNGAP